jgi:predicted Fe-S protein YdhL (DUF1289 family)
MSTCRNRLPYKMTATFKPCINRNACNDDGESCRSCGRSLEEIVKTRALVDTVYAFVQEMAYENHEEFMAYLSRKIAKKIAHATQK